MTQPNQHPYTRASITQAEITTIPIFNGDPNTLPIFIDACNDLIKTYGDRANPNNSLNTYLVRIIKSRLAGEPLSLIGSRQLKTWTDIKALLELRALLEFTRMEHQNWQYRCGMSAAPQALYKSSTQITPGNMKNPALNQNPIRNPFPVKPNFQPTNPNQFQNLYRPANQYQTNQFQTNQFRNNVPRPTYSQFQRQPQPHAKPSSFKFAKTSAQQLEIPVGTGRRAKFSSSSLCTGRNPTSESAQSKSIDHFEFNHLQSVHLPYIIIPEINAKFLVDTGASVSSISTELAQNHFPEYIYYSPFSVTTMHEVHKFNIMDFSKKYDGILGMKIMEEMEAVIDFSRKILKTKFTEIPLHFDDPSIKVGPRERRIVKIPVDRNLQEVYIAHQELAPGVEIPENLTTTQDYEAITEVAKNWHQESKFQKT
ncbi:hypothetical protein QE152_g13513 [Popillia japonica]|uniref:Peptidase A2 domain-containing protein n=1 Tax=Popillia japonica TaxID=7064 RepID=A0AAW1LDB5_POPJA